jgi:hypothetical protein
MQPAKYLALTKNVAHDAPHFPGKVPTYPADATDDECSVIRTKHTADLHSFLVCYNTDNMLRNQLVAACPDIYIYTLEDTEHCQGYSGVTTLTMLTHLWTEYGLITMQDLRANHARLIQQWHPHTPIENFFKQLDEAAAFAIHGLAPIDDIYIIMYAYDNLNSTGVFSLACREWCLQPVALQTLPNFHVHFTEAYKRLPAATKTAASYCTVNAFGAVTTERKKASNRSLVAASSNKNPPADRSGLTYCWTHGLSTNKRHNSVTCQNKAARHQDAATVNNMMGGSERIYAAADARPRE